MIDVGFCVRCGQTCPREVRPLGVCRACSAPVAFDPAGGRIDTVWDRERETAELVADLADTRGV